MHGWGHLLDPRLLFTVLRTAEDKHAGNISMSASRRGAPGLSAGEAICGRGGVERNSPALG